jgi:hypothetical protein
MLSGDYIQLICRTTDQDPAVVSSEVRLISADNPLSVTLVEVTVT